MAAIACIGWTIESLATTLACANTLTFIHAIHSTPLHSTSYRTAAHHTLTAAASPLAHAAIGRTHLRHCTPTSNFSSLQPLLLSLLRPLPSPSLHSLPHDDDNSDHALQRLSRYWRDEDDPLNQRDDGQQRKHSDSRITHSHPAATVRHQAAIGPAQTQLRHHHIVQPQKATQ